MIVERRVAAEFRQRFVEALAAFQPGELLSLTTKLGPLISAAAVARYEKRCAAISGEWFARGKVEPEVAVKRGHYQGKRIKTKSGHFDRSAGGPAGGA